MQVNLEINPGNYGIHSYEPGQIIVNLPFALTHNKREEGTPDQKPSRRETLNRSIIIMPDQLIRDWLPQSFDELTAEHFEMLTEHQPEIILFGSGPTIQWPTDELTAPLIKKNIGIEVMDTGAACRTYNILMADGRKFAAALLMI